MSDYILQVENIKKSFGGVRALKGVSLNIKKGEIHSLAGENGCGKSTLIKVISGFYEPDEGVVRIDGQEYDKINTHGINPSGYTGYLSGFFRIPQPYCNGKSGLQHGTHGWP